MHSDRSGNQNFTKEEDPEQQAVTEYMGALLDSNNRRMGQVF